MSFHESSETIQITILVFRASFVLNMPCTTFLCLLSMTLTSDQLQIYMFYVEGSTVGYCSLNEAQKSPFPSP